MGKSLFRKSIIIAMMLSTYLLPNLALSKTLRCDIAEKYACFPGVSSCTPRQVKVWNIIDLTNETYSRCDDEGCSNDPALFTPSGMFIVIDVVGHGLMAKMSVDGSLFSEAATLTMLTIVSYGSCHEI